MSTQESYPTATSGLGIPAFIELSGSGVSNANPETPSGALVGGNNTYEVTLSLSSAGGHSSTVSVTAELFDLAGTEQLSPQTAFANSYNAQPTSSSGTQESYPVPKATVGQVATVGSVTNAGSGTFSATVTAENEGQAVVEFAYPAFGNSVGSIGSGPVSGSNTLNWPKNMIYAQLLVNVVA